MIRVPLGIRGWVCGGLLLAGAVGGTALAQQRDERAPAESVGAELRLLASRAGVMFVGQVEKIEVKDGAAGEMGGGVVEITFSVEQPVLGVAGGSYVMREWAGRWTGGQQHFQVGQRAMFFLHAPSAAGLSSAVDGMMGVVPVAPMGANGQVLLDVLVGDEGAAGGGCTAGGYVGDGWDFAGRDCAGGRGRGGEGVADRVGGRAEERSAAGRSAAAGRGRKAGIADECGAEKRGEAGAELGSGVAAGGK